MLFFCFFHSSRQPTTKERTTAAAATTTTAAETVTIAQSLLTATTGVDDSFASGIGSETSEQRLLLTFRRTREKLQKVKKAKPILRISLLLVVQLLLVVVRDGRVLTAVRKGRTKNNKKSP